MKVSIFPKWPLVIAVVISLGFPVHGVDAKKSRRRSKPTVEDTPASGPKAGSVDKKKTMTSIAILPMQAQNTQMDDDDAPISGRGLLKKVPVITKSFFLKKKFQVVDDKKVGELLASGKLSRACRAGPCLARLLELTGSTYATTVDMVSYGNSYEYVLGMYDTSEGKCLKQVSDRCDVCTKKEFKKKYRESLALLTKQFSSKVSDYGWLLLRTIPFRAEVSLSGRSLGKAPVRSMLPAGIEHRFVVDDETNKRTYKVSLGKGEEKELIVDLRDPPPVEITTDKLTIRNQDEKLPSALRSPWLRWSLLGVSMTAAGFATAGFSNGAATGLGTTALSISALTAFGSGILFYF